MVPATDVGECDLHPEVGLDELGELFQAVAETATGIICSGRRRIVGWVRGFQHLYGFESLLTGAVQNGIHGLVVHGFESIGDRRGVGVLAAYSKITDVVHGYRGLIAGQNARQRWSQRNRTESGILRGRRQRMQSAIEPAVISSFHARCS